MSRDPIGYEGGTLNLYEYVRSSSIQHLDPLGNAWWDWVPIISTAMECAFDPPGAHPGDYAQVPPPSCDECEKNPEMAIKKCRDQFFDLAGIYESAYTRPGLATGPVQTVIGGVIWYFGSVYTGGVIAIDGMIRTGCSIGNVVDIGDAAREAADRTCRCP